ncbi:hypothetical protein VTJ04DRAFT_6650 [Mycothermus thermophilus]|uniref:uncharacterized protein n=1 Tax=Humicola insolens TaxID=85995 RepID=UPI003742CCF3
MTATPASREKIAARPLSAPSRLGCHGGREMSNSAKNIMRQATARHFGLEQDHHGTIRLQVPSPATASNRFLTTPVNTKTMGSLCTTCAK